MTLEDLVPSSDNCSTIPENEFMHTALVWSLTEKSYSEEGVAFITAVITREQGEMTNIQAPAPTLSEILREINDIYGSDPIHYQTTGNLWVYEIGMTETLTGEGRTRENAAFRLWEKLKEKQG